MAMTWRGLGLTIVGHKRHARDISVCADKALHICSPRDLPSSSLATKHTVQALAALEPERDELAAANARHAATCGRLEEQLHATALRLRQAEACANPSPSSPAHCKR